MILDVILPYILAKYSKQHTVIQKIHRLYKIGNMIVFLSFITKGYHFNLTELLLNMRYTLLEQDRKRFLDHEYLNKVIIWRHIHTLVIALLPVLQATIIPRLTEMVYTYSSYLGWV